MSLAEGRERRRKVTASCISFYCFLSSCTRKLRTASGRGEGCPSAPAARYRQKTTALQIIFYYFFIVPARARCVGRAVEERKVVLPRGREVQAGSFGLISFTLVRKAGEGRLSVTFLCRHRAGRRRALRLYFFQQRRPWPPLRLGGSGSKGSCDRVLIRRDRDPPSQARNAPLEIETDWVRLGPSSREQAGKQQALQGTALCRVES